MWRLLLLTSIFISHSLCCIPCDANGKAAMDKFKTFIQSQAPEDVEAQKAIQHLAMTAERHILDFLEKEAGKLDTYTIAEIVSEYKKTVDIIEATELKVIRDENLIPAIGHHFQQLKKSLKAIVKDSEERRCPNKKGEGVDSCGLMVQTSITCKTCESEKVVCAGGPPENQEYFDRCSCVCAQDKCLDLKTGLPCSPCPDLASHLAGTLNCGERNIEVKEGDDIILDCNSAWYTSLEDSYKNQFMEETDTKPVITSKPYIDIKRAKLEDAGHYNCTTILDSGMPVSKVTFKVTVMKGSEGTMEGYEPHLALPPTPEMMLEDALGVNNVVFRALTLAAAATFFVTCCLCGYIFYRECKPKDPAAKEPV